VRIVKPSDRFSLLLVALLFLGALGVQAAFFPHPRPDCPSCLLPPLEDASGSEAVEIPVPNIRFDDEHGKYVDVGGLHAEELGPLEKIDWKPEQWNALFALYVDRPGGKDEPIPVLGKHYVSGGVLRFEPRFPLARGVRYRAVYQPKRLPVNKEGFEKPIERIILLPKLKQTATTVIEHVYPTAERLPENQLKFYLHFSAPMSRGEAYDHVRLLDEKGKAVELPFLVLEQELWNADGKRFTLFFDPGRIKRGLKPREEVGPALEEGKRYTFEIDRGWRDAEGNPLKETVRKSFRVLAPDDAQVDPKSWKLQAPASGTREPFVVTFPKPLDHALLLRLLWVTDADGKKVDGSIAVTDEEKGWRFTPAKAWTTGKYYLVADTRLEDLAGNSIARPFEVDVFRPVQREIKSETVRLAFEARQTK
jgi:hypothetical protein